MTVKELNRDQLVQLKQNMLVEKHIDTTGHFPSWGELADADSLLSDDDVEQEFADVEFVTDDFWQ